MPGSTYSLKADPGSYQLTRHPVQLIHGLSLDPGGPFFEYVLTYLCASAGLTPVYHPGQTEFMPVGTVGLFPGANGSLVQMNLHEAVRLARDGKTLPQARAEQRMCCMLINTAYESVKNTDRKKLSRSPVGQYFRHVRNAASHNNKWHFVVNNRVQEPTLPARWGDFSIDHTKKGVSNPLHGTDCVYGTLQPADLLHLLRDVEALLM